MPGRRRGPIVVRRSANISGNKTRNDLHFAPWRRCRPTYSAVMSPAPALALNLPSSARPPGRRLPRAALRCAAAALGIALGSAAAADDAGATLAAGLEQQVRQLALEASQAGAPDAPRVEVGVGQLDPRLRLAPCQRIEPYLPNGTRLWGRTRIGLRCLDGAAKWNVYLPITVKVYGVALVTTRSAPAGTELTAADLMRAEVDLTEDPSPALADAALAVGRTLLRPLDAGRSLRQAHLKARQWFAAGDTVRVRATGSGFDVAGEGQALSNGVEGQSARVRTESGRILTGQPVGERQMDVTL